MSEPKFQKTQSIINFSEVETSTQKFWEDNRIFEKTIESRQGGPRFTFYEGPPTANGLPHNGHVLTRVFKDVFLRYRSMRGYQVLRKGGWDTHGLPVEVEVEKELGIHGKQAIEEYGVKGFILRCMQSVFRYTAEWERMTNRVGFCRTASRRTHRCGKILRENSDRTPTPAPPSPPSRRATGGGAASAPGPGVRSKGQPSYDHRAGPHPRR